MMCSNVQNCSKKSSNRKSTLKNAEIYELRLQDLNPVLHVCWTVLDHIKSNNRL